VTLELPTLKAVFSEEKGPEPFVVSEEFTLSTKENSNLSKFVMAWRGRAFSAVEQQGWDPVTMVGKTALVQLVHKRKGKFQNMEIAEITNENTNLKIGSIMSRPKEMPMPEQINPIFVWDWDLIATGKEPFSKDKWAKIPNFLKDKIKLSEEFKAYAPKDLDGGTSAQTTQASTQTAAPKQADPAVADDGW